MASTTTKTGHGLARVLGIKLHYWDETATSLSRGESVFSVSSADTYVEEEPTAAEWLASIAPSRRDVLTYLYNLFPFVHWIGRYNVQWLIGDLVAGITVGAVVVPQSMAYAKLAQVPVEFGLYSSFMGVLIYWFFATSKDITIGPVAVLSTLVGNVVLDAADKIPQYESYEIASALAIVTGGIVCFLGLARLGWLVEFITLPAITAFMTGSAISIAAGQVPAMMGITGFSTRDPTYLVIIHTLQNLGKTKLDAAMGLSALTLLYIIRITCTTLGNRYPERRKTYFFLSTLRTAFVILLYTMISWLVNRNRRDDPAFRILLKVPRGFQHAAVPKIKSDMVSAFAGEIPVTVIVLLIEHISISKSFGRINNYTINPSQELIAIGVTNLLGPFLGAYPATGSFSRTAIKSKAGVRTPFAGVITAIVVLLAIYALTAVFYYIPNSSLAAVIIHAVGDLITPPNTVYQFWKVSPLEAVIFFAGVFVTIFTTIENGIYTTVAASAALFLWRAFKARGRFLGKVQVHSVIGDHLIEGDEPKTKTPNSNQIPKDSDPDTTLRNIFLPIDHTDGSNPEIHVKAPYPGIFIYRFSEGYNYPNANHYLDYLVDTVLKETRRTNPRSYGRPGDRPWNDPGPRRGKEVAPDDHRPTLKAIILDFSSVNNTDVTSIQHLIDIRNQLDRHAAPDPVDWHFANINNRWTKRALVNAGFGYPTPPLDPGEAPQRWKPIFSVAAIGGSTSAAAESERRQRKGGRVVGDVEDGVVDEVRDLDKTLSRHRTDKIAVVQGINRPLFHIDLTSALQSAITNTEERVARKK
ncbi:sulfate permease [Patellaria atrata CBS 101060]|uniref:Sulfate permease n=1 Tax=Patellaria atrata CBS 101060 TaxID=1346257 RepID=A0A9P4S3M1_9PEZI|nr:sulfate permease [Patellaria atrata CBS 101060]